MSKVIFVTGTDTDVGKTTASAALLQALRQKNFSAMGYKPIASGCKTVNGELINDDVATLQRFSSNRPSYKECVCFQYEPAIAPHIATQLLGIPEISTAPINSKRNYLINKYNPDFLIIEGAGGWSLPLGRNLLMSDVLQSSNIPVILVIGAKLGCLNHAMLTKFSIQQKRCKLAGYIINSVDAKMDYYEENVAWLKNNFQDIPCLGEIPHLENFQISEEQNLAQYLDVEPLFELNEYKI